MSGQLYIERRTLQGGKSLSWDLAQHLSTRYEHGAVIIAENPAVLLASVSKQWQRIIRQMQRARSGTLNATLIYELTQRLTEIQQARMTTEPSETNTDQAIHFLTLDQALTQPPIHQTLYCTVPLATEIIQKVTVALPADAVIVLYV